MAIQMKVKIFQDTNETKLQDMINDWFGKQKSKTEGYAFSPNYIKQSAVFNECNEVNTTISIWYTE